MIGCTELLEDARGVVARRIGVLPCPRQLLRAGGSTGTGSIEGAIREEQDAHLPSAPPWLPQIGVASCTLEPDETP